jgi:hypothetical protein
MFKGQQPIIFMVFPGAKPVTEFGAMLGSSGSPTDLKTVSAEVDIEGSGFPMTVNIFVASMMAGEKGEGTFGLHVHSTDMSASIKPL